MLLNLYSKDFEGFFFCIAVLLLKTMVLPKDSSQYIVNVIYLAYIFTFKHFWHFQVKGSMAVYEVPRLSSKL